MKTVYHHLYSLYGRWNKPELSKVDRSAAYMARYLAKNIIAVGYAEKCEIQLSIQKLSLRNPIYS